MVVVFGGVLGQVGMFMRHAQYVVGDGLKVWLWHDASCRCQLLKDSYSELYTIATNKDALVVFFGKIRSQGDMLVEYQFIQDVYDWELELVDSLLIFILQFFRQKRF